MPGVETPFAWEPNAWYHLKTRVDVAADGSGVVRAKAWKKGEPEPDGLDQRSAAAARQRQRLPRSVRLFARKPSAFILTTSPSRAN